MEQPERPNQPLYLFYKRDSLILTRVKKMSISVKNPIHFLYTLKPGYSYLVLILFWRKRVLPEMQFSRLEIGEKGTFFSLRKKVLVN